VSRPVDPIPTAEGIMAELQQSLQHDLFDKL